MNTRRAYSDGDRGHDDARSETMTNATMTASLTPAVMPARHLGPVAIFQWPLAWAMICLLLAVDFVWASQVGLTIGGGEIKACWIGALLALSAAFRRRNRGIANMAEACALWFAFTAAVAVLTYLAASCAFPLQDVMMERLDRAIGFDWSAWHDAVLDRPILSCLLLVAYSSLIPQTILSIIYFSRNGQIRTHRRAAATGGRDSGSDSADLGDLANAGPVRGERAQRWGVRGERRWRHCLSARSAGTTCGRALAFRVVGDGRHRNDAIVSHGDGRAAHLRLSPHRPSRIWDRNAELGDAAFDPADRRALSGRHARRRGAGARSDRRPASAAAWSEPNSVRPSARDIGRQGPRFGPRLRFQA